MNIKIERASFTEALVIGGQLAGKNKTLPILDNVKVTLKGDKAIISSFDGEVAITKRTSVLESDEDCIFCIEPQSLIALLKSIKDDSLQLTLEKNVCKITHIQGELTLPYMSADSFPKPQVDDNANSIEVKANVVANWMKEAKNFTHKNTLYPALMCICLYWEDAEFGVAATDEFSMFHDRVDMNYSGDKQTATVITKAADALFSMLNGQETVIISNGDRNITFKTDDAMLLAMKASQEYPNFKRVIPKNGTISVEISTKVLSDAVKRAIIGADRNTSFIKVDAEELGKLTVSSEDPTNSRKAIESCDCACMGGKISIGMNGQRLLTLLNAIEGDTVCFRFSEYNKPILIKDPSNDKKELVLMPCVI